MAHTLYLPAGMAIPIQLTYTYTGTRFQSDFISSFSQFGSVKTGYRLPYVPAHQGAVQFTLEHPNIHITLVGQLRGDMLDKAGPQGPVPENSGVPTLGLLDASLAIPLGQRFRLYATGSNILGNKQLTSWRPMGAKPTAPRQIMVGLKMQSNQ